MTTSTSDTDFETLARLTRLVAAAAIWAPEPATLRKYLREVFSGGECQRRHEQQRVQRGRRDERDVKIRVDTSIQIEEREAADCQQRGMRTCKPTLQKLESAVTRLIGRGCGGAITGGAGFEILYTRTIGLLDERAHASDG